MFLEGIKSDHVRRGMKGLGLLGVADDADEGFNVGIQRIFTKAP